MARRQSLEADSIIDFDLYFADENDQPLKPRANLAGEIQKVLFSIKTLDGIRAAFDAQKESNLEPIIHAYICWTFELANGSISSTQTSEVLYVNFADLEINKKNTLPLAEIDISDPSIRKITAYAPVFYHGRQLHLYEFSRNVNY